MKQDLSKDEETREFIKNIKPNRYYKMEGTSKVIIGKQLKKNIQCNKKSRKSQQNIWKA